MLDHYHRLKASAQQAMASRTASQRLVFPSDPNEESSSSDEDGSDDEDMDMDGEAGEAGERTAPQIDDDGFQTVVSRRRR